MSLITFQADILRKGSHNVDEHSHIKATILLVEDEESVRDFVQTLLEGEGYQVLTAENGVEGVDIYLRFQEEISLVISDLKMPKMDGVEFYRALVKVNSDVRFIAMSGFAIPEAIHRLKSFGLVDVIRKPFSIEVLLQKVEAMLSEA